MTDLGGTIGVWRLGGATDTAFAQAVERLGYATLWLGAVTSDDLDRTDDMLAATTGLVVGTGIVNIWTIPPAVATGWFHRLHAAHPGRVVLGVGAGHREASGAPAATPYDALVAYVDELVGAGVPADRIVLAALGPRVLRLARDRTAGAHPYLTTAAHTASARALLGPDRLLVPELHVAVGDDPRALRDTAREALAYYLALTNYRNSWLRLGFTEADLADGGSDTLVDAVVAQGPPAAVAGRVRDHLDAGADQVAVQVLGDNPVEDLTALARELGL